MFYNQCIKAVIKIKINEIIKQRRLELGLTLKDIAQALNVSESTVSRYESNEIQNMGIDKIEALSKVLKCSPGYLMGWIPNKDTEQLTIQTAISEQEKVLLSYYNQLNDLGKNKLIDEAEDLTHNTKYSSAVTTPTIKSVTECLEPIAAHNDNNSADQLDKIKRDIERIKARTKQ